VRGFVDQKFVNGILGWLDDIGEESPEDSLFHLQSVIEAQESFQANPAAYGRDDLERFTDPFLHEMKLVLMALRRLVKAGKPYALKMRMRVGRAAERAQLPPGLLASYRASYRRNLKSAREARKSSPYVDSKSLFKGGNAQSRTKPPPQGAEHRAARTEAIV